MGVGGGLEAGKREGKGQEGKEGKGRRGRRGEKVEGGGEGKGGKRRKSGGWKEKEGGKGCCEGAGEEERMPGRRQGGGKGLERKRDYTFSLCLLLACVRAHYHITIHNRLNRSNALISHMRNETPIAKVVGRNTHKKTEQFRNYFLIFT